MKTASLLMLLALPTAIWSYGGEQCSDPNPYSRRRTSDYCTEVGKPGSDTWDCRITGQSRRRVGKVGSYYCLNGLYQNVWYTASTTEATCKQNVTANIVGTMQRDYSYDSQDSSAVQEQSKAGQCYALRNPIGINGGTATHAMSTCQGAPDGHHYFTHYFNSSGCNMGDLLYTSNTTGHHAGQQCFCNSDDGKHTPTSDCSSCDTSELQCSDEKRCGNARNKMCTWSGGSCSCKSGNFRNLGICFGGVVHDAFFESTSHSACVNMVAGTYKKFPTSSRRRGATTCYSDSMGNVRMTWNGSESIEYRGSKDLDCTGVADGQRARKTYYNDSACTQLVLSEAVYTWEGDKCGCMVPEEPIQSDCKSCGGPECATKDSCLITEEGTCAWKSASNPQCSCATNILLNKEHCWNEEAYDFMFDNVADGSTKCANGDHASATVKRFSSDTLNDGSWMDCRFLSTSMRTGAKANATHYKERSCKSVANGKIPKTAYFSDSNCNTLVTTEEHSDGSTDNICQCELYNGCKANTKFEKYYCATGEANSAIIAVEYQDSKCTIPTGVNNSYTSVSDALNPGVCGAWPPISLKPDFRMSVILTCKAAGGHPYYNTWMRQDMDSMAPQCGTSTPADLTTAESTGPIEECYCKQEYYFKKAAAAQNVQVTGNMQMTVSDVASAIVDKVFKKLVRDTIAETCGVKPTSIVGLVLSALAGGGRRLASGGVKADYVVVVPKTQESAVVTAVTTATPEQLSSSLTTKVQNSNVAFTASVTEKSTPASAPATVAATSDGSIDTAGVDASGNAIGTPLGGTATTTIATNVDATTTVNGSLETSAGSTSSASAFATSAFLLASASIRAAMI